MRGHWSTDLKEERWGGTLRKEMGRESSEHTAAGLSLAHPRDSASEHQEPAWRELRDPRQGAGDGIREGVGCDLWGITDHSKDFALHSGDWRGPLEGMKQRSDMSYVLKDHSGFC